MDQSVYGMNSTRMSSVTSTLPQLQDDPELLQCIRRRFDYDEPPPPYSSGSNTEPLTAAQERGELVCRPLDTEELHAFRYSLGAYLPAYQFSVESRKERDRIDQEWGRRDSEYRRVYRGPDLIGRPGTQRLDIMVRNSIRKRWEALGVWNSEWGIPIEGLRVGNKENNGYMWNWKWPSSRRAKGNFHQRPFEVQAAEWPPRNEEYINERAIREYLERTDQWPEAYGPSDSQTIEPPFGLNCNESHIISRPWYQWALELKEEAIKLRRAGPLLLPHDEDAAKIIRERWKVKGDWKDSWGDSPGWRWRHESPSPEPEDPNEMDFSPSEIDALESVPPPTPPPFQLCLGQTSGGLGIFGPGSFQKEDENSVDRLEAVEDERDRSPSQISDTFAASTDQQPGMSSVARRDRKTSIKSTRRKPPLPMPDGSLPSAQKPLPMASQARSLRKPKRGDESTIPTYESAPPRLDMSLEDQQRKRRNITRAANQFIQQPARNLATNDPAVHGQLQAKEDRGSTTSRQLLSEPRRSARIAQLQNAKEYADQSAKSGIKRKRKDDEIPEATEPNKLLRSKRPSILGPADYRHTGQGQSGGNPRRFPRNKRGRPRV